MMDANDPELFLDNTRTAIVNPTDLGVLYHHPYHAKVLKNKADEVGLKNVSYYGTVADPSGETVWEFLKRKLGK
jgi:hypothetical protein